MKTNRIIPGPKMLWAITAVVASSAYAAEPAKTAATPTDGAAEFAGRAARNHWYLFGEQSRSNLDSINRELRETRRPRATRGEPPVARLLQRVKDCQSLIRIDLTATPPAFSPARRVELPGDTGALLLEMVAGGEGLNFKTQTTDLGAMPGETTAIKLDQLENGTNYVLVGLERVPVGRTTLALEFRCAEKPQMRLPLDVMTPAPGRLRLTVLSDDNGKPAPAMVQLKWLTDDLVRQPGNGIEFGLQFDNQGRSTGARSANLPGAQAEPFWCVPGSVDMSLSPGRWRVGVRRGVEREVVFEYIVIRSGETTPCTLRPKRWVDMRKRGWWSGDDHVHSRLLSEDDTRHLMSWVQAEDIHLANVVKMGDIYRTYFEQRGFGPDFRVVDGEYVLSPGQECPRTHDQLGHTLAMNITSMVRDTDRYFLYDEVFDAVHAQGGLSGYAHVNAPLFRVYRDMSMNVPRQKVDFAEILQFNLLGTDLYYEFLNLGCKLTASAGSDVPWGGTIGEVRAYAYLGKKAFSADAWFDAFRRGRTFTTSGPMLELRVDDALPGDEIRIDGARKLRVRAHAWTDPKRMGRVKMEIVRHGEVLRSVESTNAIHPEAAVDFTVDTDNGCWIAARARAADGTTAHTTPVYVIRKGLRFWKFDGLDNLIAKRLASLGEIEQIIAEARRLDAEGKLSNDRYRKQLAQQGDALQQRVSQARVMYDELKRVAESERGQRAAAK
jgi:hypothetical protein